MTVNFKAPNDLDLSTVKLEVTTPAGFIGYTPTWSTPTKLLGKDDEYTFEWTGPWTYQPATGPAVPIPRGNYELAVAGKRVNSNDEIKSTPPKTMSLVEVTTIRLTNATGGDLDTNPVPGGGRRIFPEGTAPAPNDQVGNRDEVEVVTTIEPAVSDPAPDGPVKIYFKGLDVDDPSANRKSIDDEGLTSDNCLGGGCGVSSTGLLNGQNPDPSVDISVPHGQTEIRPTFRVSERQGDNYRLAASTSKAWVQKVSAKQDSLTGEVLHAGGDALREGTHVTEMLTVWRILHLEVDHLDSSVVAQTQADAGASTMVVLDMTGNSTKIEPQKLTDDSASFVVKPPKGIKEPTDHANDGGWLGADLWPKYATSNPDGFVKVSGNGKTHLNVRDNVDLTVLANVGDFYRLSDDRNVALTGNVALGLMQRLLRRVYIEAKPVERALNPATLQSFEKNLDGTEQAALPKNVSSSPSFWSVQLIEGFEGSVVSDNDPSDPDGPKDPKKNEPGTLGQTAGHPKIPDILQPTCSVFEEAVRDRKEEARWQRSIPAIAEQVMAHEVICHALDWGHEDASLCFTDYLEGPTGQDLSEDHLVVLRRLKQPKVDAGSLREQ